MPPFITNEEGLFLHGLETYEYWISTLTDSDRTLTEFTERSFAAFTTKKSTIPRECFYPFFWRNYGILSSFV